MERSELKANGDVLQTTVSSEGGNLTQYCTVQYAGSQVGVGIFHNKNEQCTFALIKDDKGEKYMLGRVSEEFPLEAGELYTLEIFFKKFFSN